MNGILCGYVVVPTYAHLHIEVCGHRTDSGNSGGEEYPRKSTNVFTYSM